MAARGGFMSFIELYQKAQKIPKFHQNKKFFQEANAIYKNFLNDEDEVTAIFHLQTILAFYTKSEHIADPSPIASSKPAKSGKRTITKFRVKAVDTTQYIPAIVDYKHIKPNGFIITNEQINKAKRLAKASKRDNIKLYKQELGADFSVLCLKGKCYAIYNGEDYALGKGAFGKVKLMQDLDTRKWYALKVLENIDINNPVTLAEVTAEHRNLMELGLEKGMLIRKPITILGKQHEAKIFIGMEFASGIPLSKLINCKLSTSEFLDAIITVLEAIYALHEKGLLHRDIKPDNIIYNPITKAIAIVDAGHMVNGDSYNNPKEEVMGTAGFIAPEVATTNTYNEKTEMYAASKTIAVALNWVKSYKNAELSEDQHYYSDRYVILDKNQIQQAEWPDEIVYNVLHYLQMMAHFTADNRPTFVDAINHFKTLKQQYVIKVPQCHNVGIVNLAELMKDDGKINNDFILPLTMLDRVWLYADDNKTIKKLHINKLIRQLEEQGIKVAGVLEKDKVNTLLKLKPGKPEHDIPDYIEAHNTDNNINNYFYLSATNSTINSATTLRVNAGKKSKDYQYKLDNPGLINPMQFDILINELHQTIEQLSSKSIKNDQRYSRTISEQIHHIQAIMQKFQQLYITKELTAKIIEKQLNNLQKQLCQCKSKNVGFFKIPYDTKQTMNDLWVQLNAASPVVTKKTRVIA